MLLVLLVFLYSCFILNKSTTVQKPWHENQNNNFILMPGLLSCCFICRVRCFWRRSRRDVRLR